MHPAVISALAALSGSAIGAMAPIASSYVASRGQLRRDVLLRDLEQRQKLYLDFIDEASRLYALSLTRNFSDLEEVLALVALSSRMRLFATDVVLAEAEKLVHEIAVLYGEPNKTADELRRAMVDLPQQPLERFSRACRDELLGLRDPRLVHRTGG